LGDSCVRFGAGKKRAGGFVQLLVLVCVSFLRGGELYIDRFWPGHFSTDPIFGHGTACRIRSPAPARIVSDDLEVTALVSMKAVASLAIQQRPRSAARGTVPLSPMASAIARPMRATGVSEHFTLAFEMRRQVGCFMSGGDFFSGWFSYGRSISQKLFSVLFSNRVCGDVKSDRISFGFMNQGRAPFIFFICELPSPVCLEEPDSFPCFARNCAVAR
jgi:hypothetical protein